MGVYVGFSGKTQWMCDNVEQRLERIEECNKAEWNEAKRREKKGNGKVKQRELSATVGAE